jgi:hypothetical protein
MYHITQYTYDRAKELGVEVSPSKIKGKKIDVYTKGGEYICSVGAKGYADFPTYMELNGIEYAKQKRKLYKMRHEKDRHKVGSRGYYADQLLW